MLTRRDALHGGVCSIALLSATSVLGPQSAHSATSEEVIHSDAEWRSLLTADQYAVLRQAATERPFTSPLLH